YPCLKPGVCPPAVGVEALLELAPVLQCWQRSWWRCPSQGTSSGSGTSGQQKPKADFAASLEEMLTRLRASSGPFSAVSRKLLGFIRTLGQPGRLLTLAVGVARTLCRAADAADLLARATLEAGLEGPAGAVACTVVTAVFGWLLGQLLQRLAHKDAGVGHRLSEQLQALSPGPVLREESADERE
ncbi:unnamed protein product, partial [Polarella glacialis]